jgi:hypothetical protein
MEHLVTVGKNEKWYTMENSLAVFSKIYTEANCMIQ